jgi:carboxyl-terminal processing protease
MYEDLLNNGVEQKIFDSYFNCILAQIDPYSKLFSEESFKEFKSHLSSSTETWGITLEQLANKEWIISSIIPGSYAWRCGKIDEGNRILSIKIDNREEFYFRKNTGWAEINNYFSYYEENGIELVILKPDNREEHIRIYDEKSDVAKNEIEAAILEDSIKCGYISLPTFYTSWEGFSLRGCSQEVGKIIYEMKKEGVESLILDLRDNSGGSINEALQLASLFIDFGALFIEQNRDIDHKTIKDFNRGTMYSDPLIIMVNRNSASASELLAGALQDHNRAIIVGDTTFGKASGQTVFPLDEDGKRILKLTTFRNYRLEGSSYESIGIIPDIILPTYEPISKSKKDIIEREPLDIQEIDKIFFNPLNPYPIDQLKNFSTLRITNNSKFKNLKELNLYASKVLFNKDYLQLTFSETIQNRQIHQKIYKQLGESLDQISNAYTINLLPSRTTLSERYKYYKDLYKYNIEGIRKDPYIEECFYILNDLKHLN